MCITEKTGIGPVAISASRNGRSQARQSRKSCRCGGRGSARVRQWQDYAQGFVLEDSRMSRLHFRASLLALVVCSPRARQRRADRTHPRHPHRQRGGRVDLRHHRSQSPTSRKRPRRRGQRDAGGHGRWCARAGRRRQRGGCRGGDRIRAGGHRAEHVGPWRTRQRARARDGRHDPRHRRPESSSEGVPRGLGNSGCLRARGDSRRAGGPRVRARTARHVAARARASSRPSRLRKTASSSAKRRPAAGHPRARSSRSSAPGAGTYLKEDGTVWRAGDRVTNPLLARTLRRLATEGVASFYRGAHRGRDRSRHGGARRIPSQQRARRLRRAAIHRRARARIAATGSRRTSARPPDTP